MGIGGQGDLRFMQLLKVGLMVFAVAMQVVQLAACNPCPNTCPTFRTSHERYLSK